MPRAAPVRRLVCRVGAVASIALVATTADARRPHRPAAPSAWWTGLDAATTRAPASGLHLLRASPRGRVRIPAGTFTMGSGQEAMSRAIQLCEREVRGTQCRDSAIVAMVLSEGIAHPVTLSPFAIDRTEVTVADYARCVSGGTCAPPDVAPDDARFTLPDLPITHVRWEDAVTFCRWAGGRLPTEAEWEYVARGSEGRLFPWGDAYNAHLANHGALADDATDATDGFGGLAPVGSFPDGATPLGVLDMAGNAAEWVADVFELDAMGRPVGYAADAQVDPPPRTTGGGFHVVRGGSFLDAPMWLRAAARDTTSLLRPATIGFRCAADVR